MQNKQQEKDFFNQVATQDEYNVFSDAANEKIINHVTHVLAIKPGDKILDVGCGSGIFTTLLQQRGYDCVGIDLSHALLKRAHTNQIQVVQADAECLPFADNQFDHVMLSALIHHLPQPVHCAKEVNRILKPQGNFVAFDPNRLNPFMYLYRDRSSPFYSSKGVTPNERPVIPSTIKKVFEQVGFRVGLNFVDGLSFRYVASSSARTILPIYNIVDKYAFRLPFLKYFRAFVFTYGTKF